jgi:nitroreductase
MVIRVELFEAISRRVSVRVFKGDSLGEGDLERILGAAILAPSAGNLQPWSFVVTKGGALKEALAEAALSQSFMAKAPIIITVCAVEDDSAARYGDRGREFYCIQDTAAAIQNILLSATALGYGTCWIGAFDEDAVRQVLGIPAGVRPVALIPLGLPGEYPPRVTRKPLEAVLRHETYSVGRSQRRQPK